MAGFVARWLSDVLRIGVPLAVALAAMQVPALAHGYATALLQIAEDARRDIEQRKASARQFYRGAGDTDDAARIHCPVLLHLAETDEFDPPELYEGFVTALRAGGTEVEVHTWPGTEHSFANRDVALHAPDAAAEAWAITVRFLRDHLLGPAAA